VCMSVFFLCCGCYLSKLPDHRFALSNPVFVSARSKSGELR
jgi:hypothetical protein